MYLGDVFEWAINLGPRQVELYRTLVVILTVFWSVVAGLFFGGRYGKPVGWAVGIASIVLLALIRQPLMYGFTIADCRPYQGQEASDCLGLGNSVASAGTDYFNEDSVSMID